MPRESQVWMVSGRTGPAGSRGHIRLEGGALVFRPDDQEGPETVFDLANVRRVRRVLGSPVLEITIRRHDTRSSLGFYFVKPPSLESGEASEALPRRQARRAAVRKLLQWNSVKRTEIAGWVEDIRRAKGA